MYLSRIHIENFRNFSCLNVALDGNVVVVGENRVGKSNLLYALRLVFDPTLPDSMRQLKRSDFWDGLEEPDKDDRILVSVDIREFDKDLDVLAILTDYRLDHDPEVVRLTYEFRPKAGLERSPESEDDYDFICYGGESESKRFGHELRRRITMDLLPALRDAENDLASWGRSPLRPLIENAFKDVESADLADISEAIQAATERLGDFDTVETLQDSLATLYSEMSGPKQDIKPSLGFAATDVTRLYRNIRLLIDEGQRSINDASLGSANIVFLTLKTLEIRRLIAENHRDHTLLAIEEPEAHLHPHLQRSVYKHFFETDDDETPNATSILLTTHSPHIASVAPIRSLLLLKETSTSGTIGSSTANIDLTNEELNDLSRYLDVTKAEMLFARGIILVEGDAEKFLFPTFAEAIGTSLDGLGITVCSVSGTNFVPYAKFLTALGIPFSVVTDWDPIPAREDPLAIKRAIKIISAIETTKSGKEPKDLIAKLAESADEDFDVFGEQCEEFGIYINNHTLEVDLFKDDDFTQHIIVSLREHNFSKANQALINEWENAPQNLDTERYLSMIGSIGKGRFAQRLADRVEGIIPPDYIRNAIEFVANRV